MSTSKLSQSAVFLSRNMTFTVKFNVGWVFSFLYFLCYGFYGAISYSIGDYILHPFSSLFITSLVFIGQLFLCFLSFRYHSFYEVETTFSIRTFGLPLVILFCILLFSSTLVQADLFSDEIAYSQISHYHALHALEFLHLIIPSLSNSPARYLLVLLSLSFLAILLLYAILLSVISPMARTLTSISVLLFLKYVFLRAGGFLPTHPPFQQVPIFIASTLGWLTIYSLRISSLIAYSLFIAYIFLIFRRKTPVFSSLLVSAALASIPICLNFSASIEHSLYGFLFLTVYLIESSFGGFLTAKRLYWFMAIGTLFRIPLFLPFLFSFFLSSPISRKAPFSDHLLQSLPPLLLTVPFFLFTIYHGTPATPGVLEISFFQKLSSFYHGIASGSSFSPLFRSIDMPWLLFLPISFFGRNANRPALDFRVIFLFSLLFFMFNSISQGLHGLSKYQLEFVVPFCILGYVKLSAYLLSRPRWLPGAILSLLSILLVFSNLRSPKLFVNIDFKHSIPVDVISILDYQKSALPSVSYPYSRLFDFFSATGIHGNALVLGATYGTFVNILEGQSLRDYSLSHSIFNRYSAESCPSTSLIDADPDVKAIAVPDYVDCYRSGINANWSGPRVIKATASPASFLVYLRNPHDRAVFHRNWPYRHNIRRE